jgi:hypothetical protein
MRRLATSALISISFVGNAYAQSVKQEPRFDVNHPLTRDSAWAEAMAHTDRTTTDYPGYIVLTEIVAGVPTIYFFSKPGASDNWWGRTKIFADGTQMTSSCDTCTKTAFKEKDDVDTQTRTFVAAYQKILNVKPSVIP